MSITIDASSLISPGEEEGEVVLNLPPPNLRTSRFVLGYTFKTALPDFAGAWTWFTERHTDMEEKASQEDEKPEEQDQFPPEVTFHASVSGAIRQSKQAFRLPTPDGGTEVVKVIVPNELLIVWSIDTDRKRHR
jgi:DnaJ family protein C protein 11